MKDKLHFETKIKAPAAKVWATMLEDKTYRQWTTAFDPTSYFEGSWEKGSRIRFLIEGGDGMYSEIVDNIPHKFISIKHLGTIKKGFEDRTSEEAKKWVPAFENYTLTNQGETTDLEVDIELDDSLEIYSMKEMFNDMWPKALSKLKEMCEANNG